MYATAINNNCTYLLIFVLGKSLEDFVSKRSTDLISRLKIGDSFLHESISLWKENTAYLEAQRKVSSLKAVNDTAERAVKLMQDFHGLITAEEEQKQFLLRLCNSIESSILIAKKPLENILNRFVFFINLNKDKY